MRVGSHGGNKNMEGGVAVLHSNMLDGYGLGMDFICLCLDFGGIASRGPLVEVSPFISGG